MGDGRGCATRQTPRHRCKQTLNVIETVKARYMAEADKEQAALREEILFARWNVRSARERAKEGTARLAELVAQAHAAGIPSGELAALTGWSRTHVHRVVRAHRDA